MALCLCLNPTGFGGGQCQFCGHDKDHHRRMGLSGPYPSACFAQVDDTTQTN